MKKIYFSTILLVALLFLVGCIGGENNGKNLKQIATSTQKEVVPKTNVWQSKKSAIKFYETVVQNKENQKLISFEANNYDQSQWTLYEQAQEEITIHYANIGGAGGSYLKLLKDGNRVKWLYFDGNASFPNQPSQQFAVRISDGLILEEQSVQKDTQVIQELPEELIGTWQSDDGSIRYILQSKAIIFNDKTYAIEKIDHQQTDMQSIVYTITISQSDFQEKYGDSQMEIGLLQPIILKYDSTNGTVDVGVFLHKV